MNRSGDDDHNMDTNRTTPLLDDRAVDALLAGRPSAGHDELREVVAAVRTSVCVQAPTPSAALAAVLDRGLEESSILPVPARPDGGRVRQWGVRTAVVLVAAAATTVSAAAANALPAPMQSAVADAVGALTPFDLPRPFDRGRADDPWVSVDPGPASELPSPPTTVSPAQDAPEKSAPVVLDRTAPMSRPGTGVTDAADRAEARSPDAEPTDRPDIGAPGPETDEPETDGPEVEVGADLPEVDGLDEGPSDEATSEASAQPSS